MSVKSSEEKIKLNEQVIKNRNLRKKMFENYQLMQSGFRSNLMNLLGLTEEVKTKFEETKEEKQLVLDLADPEQKKKLSFLACYSISSRRAFLSFETIRITFSGEKGGA